MFCHKLLNKHAKIPIRIWCISWRNIYTVWHYKKYYRDLEYIWTLLMWQLHKKQPIFLSQLSIDYQIQNICNQSAMSLQSLVVLNSMTVYDKFRKLPNVYERLPHMTLCRVLLNVKKTKKTKLRKSYKN